MHKKEIKKIFKNFKKQDFYKAWKRNLKEHRKVKPKEWLCKVSPNKWVSSAFLWDITPEGQNIWGENCEQWEDFLLKKGFYNE